MSTVEVQPMDTYREKLAEVVARDEIARGYRPGDDWDEKATAAGWPADGEVPV